MQAILSTIDDALRRKGLSDAAASKLAVGNPSLLKNMRNSKGKFSYAAVERLAEVLDLEFYVGPPRRPSEIPVEDALPDRWDDFTSDMLPRKGIASCGVNGWGKDQPYSAPLPAPSALEDPRAFYVAAAGDSMRPEGINAGMFCLVSPAEKARPGDRIWIRDKNSATAIKRLVRIEDESLHLRGWQPRRDGQQESFEEDRRLNFIAEYHPVVAVYHGIPGGEEVRLMPDPKPPTHASPLDGDLIRVRLHDQQFSAGSGALEDESVMSSVAFPAPWLRRLGLSERSAALVWVKGDSMEPTLKSGSMAMLDTRIKDIKKRCVVAFRLGEELFIKRLEWATTDMLIAHSDNPDHDTMIIAGADLEQFEMFGEVVWSGHQIKG